MISVAAATLADLKYIDHLQRKNAEELSFYPASAFECEVEKQRIVVAKIDSEPVGYLYHGALGHNVKIHQACIQYDARGYLYGSEMVRWIIAMAEAANASSISLRCGSDISSNGFWKMMGFYCQTVTQGGGRRMRDINGWRYDIQPPLFVTETIASEKRQDASAWRKRTVSLGSQFIRGKALVNYRKALELNK